MLFKSISFLICIIIVSCANIKLEEEDEAVLDAFTQAMKLFNQSFGLEMEEFLMVVGDDEDTEDTIENYFEKNPQARHLWEKINEGIFFDLVSKISEMRRIPLLQLAKEMKKAMKYLIVVEEKPSKSSTKKVILERSLPPLKQLKKTSSSEKIMEQSKPSRKLEEAQGLPSGSSTDELTKKMIKDTKRIKVPEEIPSKSSTDKVFLVPSSSNRSSQ